MKNKTTKLFSAVYFVCIISCILLSAYLVSDVWARYFSTASGSDSARVAKWDVQVHYPDTAPILELKEDSASGDYTFTVVSSGEVSVGYDVLVSWTGNWPAGVTLSLDGSDPIIPTGNSHIFFDAGSIAPNGGSSPHTLTVTAESFDSTESLGIVVSVNAEQVD